MKKTKTKKMNKQEKEMEQYIINLCKEADVDYDPEFGSHMDDEKFKTLLAEDIQKELDYLTAEGFCDKVDDKYIYRENPVDVKTLNL